MTAASTPRQCVHSQDRSANHEMHGSPGVEGGGEGAGKERSRREVGDGWEEYTGKERSRGKDTGTKQNLRW